MYADDTIIYSSNCDVSIATSQCEEALKQLSAWCINNKLTINTKKTKVMSIARNDAAKEKMNAVDVKLAGESLVKVKAYKYLGEDLDEHLSLNTSDFVAWSNLQKEIGLHRESYPGPLTLSHGET